MATPGHPRRRRSPARCDRPSGARPCFFAELEHALGLRELPETPEEHAERKAAEAAEAETARRQHPSWANTPNPPKEWAQHAGASASRGER